MSEVTVRAVQPVLGLADGAVVTVERTPMVDAAIRHGRLVELPAPVAGLDVDAEAAERREASQRFADETAAQVRAELGVPSRSASRAEWAAFADLHELEYTARTTRDGLIELWDNHDCTHKAVKDD